VNFVKIKSNGDYGECLDPGFLSDEEGANVVVMTEVGRAHQGSMFGEKAIISPEKGRAVNVRCTKNCIFLVLTGRDYSRYMRRVLEKRDDEKISFLRSTPLFKSWSKGLARNTLTQIKIMHLLKGKTVLQQGQLNSFLFFIRSGSVEMSLKVKKPHA